MLSAVLDAASLAQVRLAASPTYEAMCWLETLRRRQRHPLFGDPGAAARWTLRDPDVRLVLALLGPEGGANHGYMPDLLTPKPSVGADRFALQDQLDHIEHTSQEAVQQQVVQALYANGAMPQAVRLAVDDGSLPLRVAAGLRTFWASTLAEGWSQLQRTIEADVAHRSAALAAHGVGLMLNALHERVSWTGTALRIETQWDGCVPFRDQELVLVPNVLGWPGLAIQIEDPDNAMLAYPAFGRGAASLATGETPGAFGQLLGTTRTQLLRRLDLPRSTTQLSADLDLAISTVSYHLGVLLRTGLVARHRQRRVVHYRRTPQGDALLDGGVPVY